MINLTDEELDALLDLIHVNNMYNNEEETELMTRIYLKLRTIRESH